MKKPLNLIMLTAVIITATAQEQLPPIDDATIRGYIRDYSCGHLDEGIPPIINRTEDLLLRYDISKERMARILEEMIQEELLIIEAKPFDYDEIIYDSVYLSNYINDLEIFHNANTLALLKECAMSKEEGVRYRAVNVYVLIAGAESIPLVREVLTDGRIKSRYSFIKEFLPETVARLKDEGKTADAEKFMAFLKELEQQEPSKPTEIPPTTTPPPQPEPTTPTITNETAQPIQETPPEQPEKTSINSNSLWFVVITLFAAISGVAIWKKKIIKECRT